MMEATNMQCKSLNWEIHHPALVSHYHPASQYILLCVILPATAAVAQNAWLCVSSAHCCMHQFLFSELMIQPIIIKHSYNSSGRSQFARVKSVVQSCQ